MRKDPIHQHLLTHPRLKHGVMVATSGGLDSMVLLHALYAVRQTLGITLHVATFDHRLRPESAEDTAFVATWCAQHGIPCHIGRADVSQEAQAHQENIEATARRLRYTFLAQTAEAHACNLLLTAHHADDQAETVLWHIVRGAGLDGLAGMSILSACPFAPHIALYRPLLAFYRHELEAYQQRHAVPYREDSTNANTRYTRNALRHNTLPHLSQYNPQLTQALTHLAHAAHEAQDFIHTHYQHTVQPHITATAHGWYVPLATFIGWHRALQTYFVQQAFYALAPVGVLAHAPLTHALTLAQSRQVNKVAELGAGVSLRCRYDALSVERTPPTHTDTPLLASPTDTHTLAWDTPIYLATHTLTMSRTLHAHNVATVRIPKGATVQVRGRTTGDTWQPRGMGGHSQTVKKWMIDHKIPSELRARVPLLVVNGSIVAIVLKAGWATHEASAEATNQHASASFDLQAYSP